MAEKSTTHSVVCPQPLSPEQITKINEVAYEAFEPCSMLFALLEDSQFFRNKPESDWWYVGKIGAILFAHGQGELRRELEKLAQGGGDHE